MTGVQTCALPISNELWNSDMNSARDQMPPVTKFVPPTVVNGKVYVPSASNVVTVYGLFSLPAISPRLGIPNVRRSR